MAKLNFSTRDLLMPVVLVIFFFIFHLGYVDIKDRTINEFNHEQFILAKTALLFCPRNIGCPARCSNDPLPALPP